MKIFHITDHLPGYHKVWGGAEQVAYRFIKLLSDSDNEIAVGGVKSEKTIDENFKFLRIRVVEDLFPEKMQVYVTGLKNRIFSFDPISFFHLLLVLQRAKPNVVHFHKFNKISFSAILAAKLSGAKTVLGMYDYWYLCPGGMLIDEKGNLCHKFHGSWCAQCDAVADFRFLLPVTSPVRKPLFNFFYRFIDQFAVLSKAQGELLENYGISKKKIYLLRQVFNLPEAVKNIKQKEDIVLFAGWIDFRKGLHILIEALPEILKKCPNVVLWVLQLESIPEYERMVSQKINELGLSKRVKFFGRLTKEKFRELLLQSTTVVVPEQWENMSPVIVVEAMASGKVVVASDIGGIPEFIQDGTNGFLADYNQPESFAEKTIKVLKNREARKKLGQRATKDVTSMCNQDKIRRDLLKLYQS